MPAPPPTEELEPSAPEIAPIAAAPDVFIERRRQAATAPKRWRARSSYLVALMVVVVAWGGGLLGAWMGVRLADQEPARTPSTLGLVKVEPRTQPLPALDVFAAASAIGPSVVNVTAIADQGDIVRKSSGSGVVLTADGEIVTNAHVVAGAITVSVRLPGESEPRGAVVVASDAARDLALLRIDAVGLVPASFADAGDIRVGDSVVAVGYALDLDGDPTVSAGIVSALHRTSANAVSTLKGLIQTDAPISSGNSGGALVNSLGQVVGITTFVAITEVGTAANSLGFAISNEELLPMIQVLRDVANGEVQSAGYLGVSLIDRLDGGSGAQVSEVLADSPAATAGVEVGDSIVQIDGVEITGRAGLVATIRDRQPGDEIRMEVRRAGAAITLRVTLAERISG